MVQAKEYDKGIATLERCLALAESTGTAIAIQHVHSYLARAYWRAGDPFRAKSHANKAISVLKADPQGRERNDPLIVDIEDWLKKPHGDFDR